MAVVSAAIAIGNNVLVALSIQTSSIAVIAGVGFATQAAIGLALNALTPKPSLSGLGGRKERGYTVNQREPALDHQIIYGRARVGGAIVFQGTTLVTITNSFIKWWPIPDMRLKSLKRFTSMMPR